MTKPATYNLVIVSMPSDHPAPARLKALLKLMKRHFGFRCVRITEGVAHSTSADQGDLQAVPATEARRANVRG